MVQWGEFILDVVLSVFALLATFEGTRRIAGHGSKRNAAFLLGAGLVLCALKGGVATYTATQAGSLADQGRPVPELAQDWGAELSPQEREKSSLAYASVAFTSTG